MILLPSSIYVSMKIDQLLKMTMLKTANHATNSFLRRKTRDELCEILNKKIGLQDYFSYAFIHVSCLCLSAISFVHY